MVLEHPATESDVRVGVGIVEQPRSQSDQQNVRAGRLTFTTDFTNALTNAEFAFIAVGTPSGVDGARCTVKYPVGMRDEEVALLVRDCEDDLASVEACFHRLGEIGRYRFNYSSGETMRLALRHWVGAAELMQQLSQLPTGSGDVYARL